MDGGFHIAVSQTDGTTRLADLEERGGWRIRFPEIGGERRLEAVSINTGGGIIGGDRVDCAIEVESGHLSLATQAAERIYRSLGPAARIDARLSIGADGVLEWLPQETILFSGARLQRRYDIEMAASARLLMLEMIVLGRTASGERVRDGSLNDQWRVRRDGKLIFAEAIRLDGDMHTHMQRAAIGEGARAMALLLLVAPGAEEQIDLLRATFANAEIDCGASAWNGMLTARLIARDTAMLRQAAARAAEVLMGRQMPRVWSL